MLTSKAEVGSSQINKRGLVASALAGFDRRSLTFIEIATRLIVAILILAIPAEIYGVAIFAGVGVLGFHFIKNKEVKSL